MNRTANFQYDGVTFTATEDADGFGYFPVSDPYNHHAAVPGTGIGLAAVIALVSALLAENKANLNGGS